MITVTVERKRGAATHRVRVSAPTIERALEIVGADDPRASARIVFPIDGDTFFATAGNPVEGIDYEAMNPDEIEDACEAGLPGAREAWLDFLRDGLGAEGFERYVLENCLI